MTAARRGLGFSRWWLIAVAGAVFGVAGTYQFAWSSVRGPLSVQLAASEAALGTVFTVFVTFQTISQFPAGWARDRYGPRVPLVVAGILLTSGYLGTALTTTFPPVYLFYALGGVGVGITYTVAVNTPVKWFDDRRGLATGVVTMAYSGFSFVVIPILRGGTVELREALVSLAILAGVTAFVAAFVLRDPDQAQGASNDAESIEGENEREAVGEASPTPGAYTWRDAVRTWQFWLLYAILVIVNGVGLMVIGKAVALAENGLGLSAVAATGSASLIALGETLGIVTVAGISDRLGRERTFGATLILSGLSLGGGLAAGSAGSELAFVLLIGAVAFFRSPAFSIVPSMMGDYYGQRYSSENYALLYSSKVFGGVLGGVVASALILTIGWTLAFLIGGALLFVAGVAAFFLRPVSP